jgi:universal stress protein A
MRIRQIMAPTDFSEGSKQAIAYAYELAQAIGAKLVLLHVIEELPSYIGFVLPGGAAMILEDLGRQACLDLAEVLPEAKAAEVEVTRRVVEGSPPHKILEVAAAEKIDLIVIATHGCTGFSHLFMGSVAEKVVRAAPCPVITIRPVPAKAPSGHAPAAGRVHTGAG